MAWSTLKKSFLASGLIDGKNKPLRRKISAKSRRLKLNLKRDESVHISDCSDDDFPYDKCKKSKLDVVKYKAAAGSSFSSEEGRIDYDPDISYTCNGCSPKAVGNPLYVFSEKCRPNTIVINEICAQEGLETPGKTLPLKNIENFGYGVDDSQGKRLTQPEKVTGRANVKVVNDTENSGKINKLQNVTTSLEYTSDRSGVKRHHNLWIGSIPRKANHWCSLQKAFDENVDGSISEQESETEIFNNTVCAEGKHCRNFSKDSFKENEDCIRSEGHEENTDLNSLILDIKRQNPQEKKIRVRKGGFLEKLRKALHSSESDHAFWQHERKLGLSERGHHAVVKKKVKSFGITILTLDIGGKDVNIILLSDKEDKSILAGSIIEICISNNIYSIDAQDICLLINKYAKKYFHPYLI